MKTSIIIPVYNVEKYLECCVKSVMSLKCETEILLIDDGSTDKSGKICDSFAEKDSRIKVIHKENRGLSAARNTGIENSNSDYLLFLDSDDFLDAEETERLIQKTNSGVDIGLGLYREYYEKENVFKKEKCTPFLEHQGVISVDEFLKTVPNDGQSCYLTAWRFIVKRDFLIKNNLYFFEGIYHEDEEWVPRLLFAADKINVTDCFFYCYRQDRMGSITGKINPKRVWDTFTIMEHHQKLLETKNLNLVQKEFLLYRMASLFSNNIINYKSLDKEDKKVATEKLKTYYSVCNKYLKGKRNSIISFSVKLLGVKATAEILRFVNRLLGILKK